MILFSLSTEITNYLRSNVAINAYCQQKYSKDQVVFFGIDLENPPDPAIYPVFSVKGIEPMLQEGERYENYKAELSITIKKEGFIDNQNQGGALIYREYTGLKELLELLDLFFDEILKARILDFRLGISAILVDSLYPIFHADIGIVLERPRSTRR